MAKAKERVKKTYNLDPETVDLVRSMVGSVADTQDAVVVRSVRAMARRLRDREHSRLWAEAASDPEFQREMRGLFEEFEADDRAAWEVGP